MAESRQEERARGGGMDLSENAIRVLRARYLRRDAAGSVAETPGELFERVARAAAMAERQWGSADDALRWEEEFRRLLSSLEFLPNSPALMNAGGEGGQLAACFVLPVEDTMDGIFQAVRQMALVQKTGGGTGFSFSRLRPQGDTVASTGGEASGPVSFMRVFDCATEHIKQGGRRRGANMGVLRVDHPDVLEFIRAKRDGRSFPNFNLSVGVTDGFMEAVRQGGSYPLIHPRTGREVRALDAQAVFREIAEAAWAVGDPGLLFLDAINRANPTPELGTIEASNPCGEVPLLPYEACILGSLNLIRFIRAGPGARATVDWPRLRAAVHLSIRFLDDILEASVFPVPEIGRMTRRNRKVGLGVMGFAELLVRMGISYAHEEAVRTAEELMGEINREAFEASRELAAQRGLFPHWERSIYADRGERLRNAARTAVAPTGTISIIAGTSPGIEPLFALAYRRTHVLGEQTLCEVHPLLLEALRRHGTDGARVEEVLRQGTLSRLPGLPEEVRRLFVTALEVPPEQHLRIQVAFQRHVDGAVSKTINLPGDAAPEDVAQAYRRAWELGLKGITLYRYGSRAAQVLELGAGEVPFEHDHAARCDPGECRL